MDTAAVKGRALLTRHNAKNTLQSLDDRIISMAGELTCIDPQTLGHPSAEAFVKAVQERATAVAELKIAESLCRKYGLL